MSRISLLSIGFLVFSLRIASGQNPWIDPVLFNQLNDKPSCEAIIALPAINLRDKISASLTKKEKGRLAFELLKNHANRQFQDIIPILDAFSADYKTGILTATIYVPRMNQELLNRIKATSIPMRIYPNYMNRNIDPFEISSQESSARNIYTWGLQMTGADKVQEEGIRGQGVVIGGNDTGFDWTHPAIRDRYRGWNNGNPDHNYNWHDAIHQNSPLSDSNNVNPCGLDLKFPCDDSSHGTHTMGTMVGSIDDTIIIGMAPDAQWIATRNMERGNGSLASYLEAFEWFLAPTDTLNQNPDPDESPDVINNSWYCSVEEGCNPSNWELMRIAVSNLRSAGIMVVVSAGNSGPSCETIQFVPAMLDEAFSIGATGENDTIAAFSSRGMVSVDSSMRLKPDVSAPGVRVYSSVLQHKYAFYSGTSMAGPHVAGLVALIISANPALAGQVDTIESIIIRSAVPKILSQDCSGVSGLDVPNPIYGHGRIDAYAAVELAKITLATGYPVSQAGKWDIYPNPADQSITIVSDHYFPIRHMYVSDITGRRIKSLDINLLSNSQKIDVHDLHPGIYFISINDGTLMITRKFIIAR